jgi:molecular chaperone GrpE (heat shock protein)
MAYIKEKARLVREFWKQKIVLGSLRTLRDFAHNQIRLRDDTYGLDQDWKARLQADFQSWLMDLSHPPTGASTMAGRRGDGPRERLKDFDGSNPDPGVEDYPEVDLFTLLSEFASLRTQIQLQTREQARNVKALDEFNGFVDKTSHLLTLMDEKISRMDAMEIQVQDRTEEKILKLFFDLRNNLKRGREAGQKALNHGFVWRRKRLTALVQGYEIALNKFDKALAAADTYPVVTQGEPFDPAVMRAVDRVSVKGVDAGMVHAEVACGFIRRERVILPADVIVTQ